MPLVRVRIQLGKQVLGSPAAPYAENATIKIVLDRVHAGYARILVVVAIAA